MTAVFLEDLITPCVMESIFREHMASRQLSVFHVTVAPALAAYAPKASAAHLTSALALLRKRL